MKRTQKSRYRRLIPCSECGKVTRRAHDLCATCLGYEYSALSGGQWVLDPVRMVQVWEPFPMSEGRETMAAGHRRKSALTGAATPHGQGLADRKGHRPTHG